MRLLRSATAATADQLVAGADQLVASIRACSAGQRVTLRVSTSTARTRRSIAELLQAHAYAAHCQVALAETRGIAVRWVDGIVTGTPDQLAEFLTTVRPVLARAHGQAALAAA